MKTYQGYLTADGRLLGEIILDPEQEANFARHMDILENRSRISCDHTSPGGGKTYMGGAMRQRNYARYPHYFAIAALTVLTKHRQMERTFYDCDLTMALTYNALASKRFKQPSHGLLVRHDYQTEVTMADGFVRTVDKTEYRVTEKWRNMVREGVLLIVDEYQETRNADSLQTLAVAELIREIVQATGPSRVMMFSGTPFCKPEQSVNFFRTIGVMTKSILYRYIPATGEKRKKGLAEIEAWCEQRAATADNSASTASTFVADPLAMSSMDRCQNYVFNLFLKYALPHMTTEMPDTFNANVALIKTNCFMMLHHSEVWMARRGVELMRRGLRDDGNIQDISIFQKGNECLETAGVGRTCATSTFARIVMEELAIQGGVPNAVHGNTPETGTKVIVGLHHTANIHALHRYLAELGVRAVILNGQSGTVQQRAEIMAQFQAPDLTCRVLICNMKVSECGIDLDDMDGRFPRVALVSPNFRAIMHQQFGHRIRRRFTRSDGHLKVVYYQNDGCSCFNVLNNLHKKGEVMKQIVSKQTNTTFLCDYGEYYENPKLNTQRAMQQYMQRHRRRARPAAFV